MYSVRNILLILILAFFTSACAPTQAQIDAENKAKREEAEKKEKEGSRKMTGR